MEPTIDCRGLLIRLGDDELLVLDCRPEDDIEPFGVQIPGALTVAPSELAEAADGLPDDELIVVCGSGSGGDASRACRTLRLRGYDAVVLQGGLRAWISQGYPTERRAQRSQLQLQPVHWAHHS